MRPNPYRCYFMLKHYENGEQIETNEACLNCTCVSSMLMCYLRVCPYVKQLGDDCTVTKRPGECCPDIACPAGTSERPDTLGAHVPVPTALYEPETEAPFADDGIGCFIDGRHYSEGARMPKDPKKPCEVCYCIRNSSACVLQDCELHVDGCSPVFSRPSCCPTRYNCSREAATTVPPGFMPTEAPEIGCMHEAKYYEDGAQVPSGEPCKHCYCMRNEVVCAVQDCKAPSDGCTAMPTEPGHCCPMRYECRE
ncbi:hypothetical protein HPB48_006942 [Haemaphysalis longicornis]|uniref:VWFC domain-containing protein n=1 Tax=Haemaphysalis longicornis TaxID=44386 RepID=A0A9J6GNR3_HAELO|nr:hypothetical protein HPB48_006942 [Haemaphysalis longicornis]